MIKTAFDNWKQKARKLKIETYAVYLAYKDPRVPWYARIIAACVVAYAFSPIDLIPDPIPVLGYLDDLILIPLGIALVIKMIPPSVMDECREKSQIIMEQGKPKNWIAASLVIVIWLSLFIGTIVFGIRLFKG